MKVQIAFAREGELPDWPAIEAAHSGDTWALLVVDESGSASINSACWQQRKVSAATWFLVERWPADANNEDHARKLALKHWPKAEIHVALPPPKTNAPPLMLGVIVTCHPPYVHMLADTLRSIDANEPGERILVLDGCDYTAPEGWRVVRGDWRDPNAARNAGMAESRLRWLVFWDADDRMPPSYLAAIASEAGRADVRTAILYPTVMRGALCPPSASALPWDYWKQRDGNQIVTCSAWLKKAVETVGGWPEGNRIADDLALGLRVTGYGFTARHVTPVVNASQHQLGHRSKSDERITETLWNHRTFAIVTIHCGREERHLDDWLLWLATAELPPHVSLYAIDSSGSPDFRKRLDRAIGYVESRFEKVTVAKWRERGPEPLGDRTHWRRHADVCEDYTRTLRGVTEDMVLFVDDDTVPQPNALLALHEHFRPHCKLGAVGAAYETSRFPGFSVGSTNPDGWELSIPWPPPSAVIDATFLGGGCTLFANSALRQCLPLCAVWNHRGEAQMSWDTYVSLRMRELGYKLQLDGRITAQHNFAVG